MRFLFGAILVIRAIQIYSDLNGKFLFGEQSKILFTTNTPVTTEEDYMLRGRAAFEELNPQSVNYT